MQGKMENGTQLHLREKDWAYPQTCSAAMLLSLLYAPPQSTQNPVLRVNNTTLKEKGIIICQQNMIPIPTTILSSRSQLYVSATITSNKICIQDESSLNLDGIPTTLSQVFIIFLLFQMNVILVP